jgi:hypothetical protein
MPVSVFCFTFYGKLPGAYRTPMSLAYIACSGNTCPVGDPQDLYLTSDFLGPPPHSFCLSHSRHVYAFSPLRVHLSRTATREETSHTSRFYCLDSAERCSHWYRCRSYCLSSVSVKISATKHVKSYGVSVGGIATKNPNRLRLPHRISKANGYLFPNK